MPGRDEYRCTLEDTVFLNKFHNDLYQTMTELYMENMLCPVREWSHGLGMELRAEISLWDALLRSRFPADMWMEWKPSPWSLAPR